MFNKDKRLSKEFDTLIGKNTSIDGDITIEGSMRIDGKIIGNVKISGNLYVGKEAIIKGNVEAVDVHMSGNIEGNVSSCGILKLHSTSRLCGDIISKSFVADEGGFFQGNCKMIEEKVIV